MIIPLEVASDGILHPDEHVTIVTATRGFIKVALTGSLLRTEQFQGLRHNVGRLMKG